MNSDRWNRIEFLYTSALELNKSERQTLLDQQCDGDDSLKSEVLSLLDSADRNDSFMEEPDVSLALEVLRAESNGLVGTNIGRYLITGVLGHGGMGDVYLAHDPSLNRKVALKLLPATITDNHLRVLRFQHEARAASAISHPNVAHIYEIGEADGRHYITMEYVKGATLRELINADLDVEKAIDIIRQVCNALAAAHRSGVVHRDIKPENVVVTDDGYVKVLDFGLAKLMEGVRDEFSDSALQPELLMGTWHYMSPEQVRRQPVDHRTDLWSLGVVLFELLLRRRPFPGETPGEVIAAILEREPKDLTKELLSFEVRSLLVKALSKEPNARYQSADALLHDLQQLDASRISKKRFRPGSSTRNAVTHAARIDTIEDESLRVRPRINTYRKLSLIVPLILLVTAASYLVYKATRSTPFLSRPLNLRFERLPLSGDIAEIVLSPDGKYIAYSVVEASKHSIHVRELATSNDLRVTPVSDLAYSGLSFSPDGSFVYYLENHAETGTLYRVSKGGGEQNLVLENVNTAATFSPDGSQIAFVRTNNSIDPADLVIASADGSSASVLTQRTLADSGFFSSDMHGPGPVWSPDGKTIACVTHGLGPELTKVSLEVIEIASKTVRQINAGPFYEISRITWLGDGSGLIVAGTERSDRAGQLYLVDERGSGMRQITNDPNNYSLVSGAKDSSIFVTRNVEWTTSLWRVSLPDSNTISVEQKKGLAEVTRTPDGRLIYSIFDGKHINLWVQDVHGTRQLTFEGDNSKPVTSPDGRYIVFCSTRAGGMNLWRMNSDGTQPVQLSTGTYQDLPSITADNKWVVYRTGRDVRKISIDGGPPLILLTREVQGPSLSPDGKLLAFFVNDQPDSKLWRIELIDLGSGSIVRRFDLPEATSPFNGMVHTPDNRLQWTPDGKGIAYVSGAGGASNVWIQPISGGQFRKLTDFKEAEITSFAWSGDGDGILLVRNTPAYVPVLIKLFQ